MFCPIKANKSRKSLSSNRNTNSESGADVSQQNQQNQHQHQQQANNPISNPSSINHHNSNSPNANNNLIDDHCPATNGSGLAGASSYSGPHIRFVTAHFQPEAEDELAVQPNDIVILEYTDSNPSGNWSHVVSIRDNKSGFVPSKILTSDPKRNPQYKKKLPRSMADNFTEAGSLLGHNLHHQSHHHLNSHTMIPHHHHSSDIPHPQHQHRINMDLHSRLPSSVHHSNQQHLPPPHHQQYTNYNMNSVDNLTKSQHNLLFSATGCDQPSINGDNVKFHPNQMQPNSGRSATTGFCDNQIRGSSKDPFSLAHSNQGSSGKQSFQKYPDLSPPAYYNLKSNDPVSHYEHFGLKCTQFIRNDFGSYIVTNNFVPREENDLSVRSGETVIVLNKDDQDWYWVRREDLSEGFVPSRYICDFEQVRTIIDKGNSTVTMKSSNHNDYHTYMNHAIKESLTGD